ncbi:hypothetical protein [Flavobacterium croceum]|uniref:hypothetical protein n=1 Tax=Flavobacterium croceum TaxID=370975 RepID=UPI0024A90379|nr:hypothetical protein [Flavobacterium croceum]
MKPKIYIYALLDVYYDAYYIQGLKEYFGVKKVYFNTSKFPKFNQDVCAILVEYPTYSYKIAIDSRDNSDIRPELEQWCDVYGVVNVQYSDLARYSKVISIGPSFGIKTASTLALYCKAFCNVLRFFNHIPHKKRYVSNFIAQSKRNYLHEYYKPIKAQKKYLFFTASLWKNEPETNAYRANFIRACKALHRFTFEGGFVPRSNGDNLGYDDLLASQKIFSLKEYTLKIKQSMVVFNTPAVLQCHGWKLGEFLAMGKAIISTKFYNEMPAPFINNEHYVELQTNTSEEIQKVLLGLKENPDKLIKLETNAFHYFQKYLTPVKVIQRIVEKAEKN